MTTTKKERVAVPDAKIKPPPPAMMGIREYARHRTAKGSPITHAGVRLAISSGRIAAAVWRDERGKPRIHPDIADKLFEANTDPSAQRETKLGGRPHEAPSGDLFADGGPEPETVKLAGDERPKQERDDVAQAFNASRRDRMSVDAQLAQLKLDRELGELVRVEDIRPRLENLAVTMRERLRDIPSRVAAEIAAETSVHRVREILTVEIDRVLEGFAELDRAIT